jgi:hypothetical protein
VLKNILIHHFEKNLEISSAWMDFVLYFCMNRGSISSPDCHFNVARFFTIEPPGPNKSTDNINVLKLELDLKTELMALRYTQLSIRGDFSETVFNCCLGPTRCVIIILFIDTQTTARESTILGMRGAFPKLRLLVWHLRVGARILAKAVHTVPRPGVHRNEHIRHSQMLSRSQSQSVDDLTSR